MTEKSLEDKTLELAKFSEYPFRLVPGERVTVWAGYEEVRRKLFEAVESCRTDSVGLYQFVVLHGEYGTGKSHALRHLRYKIMEDRKDEFRSLVIYLERLKVAPKTDFLAIYKTIIETLADELKGIGEMIRVRVEQRTSEEWTSLPLDQKRYMREHDFRNNRRNEIYSQLSPRFPPFPALLARLLDEKSHAMSILLGNKHRQEELRLFNLNSSIDTDYDALRCLGELINLCTRKIDLFPETPIYKCFYLFIDEVEQITDFKTEEVLSINWGMRDLVDACPENFCLLLGITGDAATVEAVFEESVLRRFSQAPIAIEAMDEEQSVDFIKEVIKNYRSDTEVSECHPFTEEALKEIVSQTTYKTPRELFRNCHIVLRKAVLSGRLESKGTIDIDDVKEFLE